MIRPHVPLTTRYVDYGKVFVPNGALDFSTLAFSDPEVAPFGPQLFNRGLVFPDSSPFASQIGRLSAALLMFTAADDSWQPVDFVNSFKPAGEAVLRGEDPVLASNGGWHFLPTIPYVYGILLWFGIPWEYAGRLVTVVADIVLIPLVAKLAGGPKASLRAFQLIRLFTP